MRRAPTVVLLTLSLALAACDAERSAENGVDAATDAIEAIEPVTEPAAAAAAIPAAGDSRMDGYADLEFGMTADEARADWSGNPLESLGEPADGSSCHHLVPAGQATPADLAFMFEDDLFVRYSVESTEVTAPGGGRVGMDEATLQGLYGERLQSTPHKYVEKGKVLMSPEDGGALPSRLFFELGADGVVSSWRVGMVPQVGYVEGCS
ncbi:lectin [Luteimonas sp. MJ246]|uniref:lectin n=1 Tax=Luteimonas sp. MJ174 TaxID=3129237 RepID=UPI0031BADD54